MILNGKLVDSTRATLHIWLKSVVPTVRCLLSTWLITSRIVVTKDTRTKLHTALLTLIGSSHISFMHHYPVSICQIRREKTHQDKISLLCIQLLFYDGSIHLCARRGILQLLKYFLVRKLYMYMHSQIRQFDESRAHILRVITKGNIFPYFYVINLPSIIVR